MSSRISRLPSRFPLGTRYVVEGRAGCIHLRYLEFPDGRQIPLPSEPAGRRLSGARRGQPSRGTKKNSTGQGTVRGLAR
jgi:hypothetical protein